MFAIFVERVDRVFSKEAGEESSFLNTTCQHVWDTRLVMILSTFHGHSDTIAKCPGFKLPACDVSEKGGKKGWGRGLRRLVHRK